MKLEKYLINEGAGDALFRTASGFIKDASDAYKHNNFDLVEKILRKGLPPVLNDILTEIRKKK